MLIKLFQNSDRLIASIFTLFINLYKKTSILYKPKCCRFYPTCSSYSIGVLKKHGFVFGIPKIFYRIIRCNPFNQGGYDPY